MARIQSTTDLLSNIEWTAEDSAIMSRTGSVTRVCLFNISGSYEAALFVDQDSTNPMSGTLVYSSSDSTGDTGFNSDVHPFLNGKRWYYAAGVLSGSSGYQEYMYFGQQYENVSDASASFLVGAATSNFIVTRAAFGNDTEIVVGTGLGSFASAYGHAYYTEFKTWNNCPGTGSLVNRVYDVHDYACGYISERSSSLIVHVLGVEDVVTNSAGKCFIKNRAMNNDTPVFTGSVVPTNETISVRHSTVNYFTDVEAPGNIKKVRIHNSSKLKNRTIDLAAAGIEISPATSINKDIIRHLPTVELINDYVGKGIEQYRDEYRELEIARNTIFGRYRDEGVDINTFFDACHFLDMRFVDMFRQFIPANVSFLGAEKTVESHGLERNKIGYRYSVYHTFPDLTDNSISASAVVSGNVCMSASNFIACSGSQDGYTDKEQIAMFHNVWGGKVEKADCTFNKDVQFEREPKRRIFMRSQKRPNLPTTMYESCYDSAVKSPNDLVCINNELNDYEMKLLSHVNNKPFHRTERKLGDIVPPDADAVRRDVFEEQGYQHHRDQGYYGGNSGIQSFHADGLPVRMHSDVIWHKSGTFDIASGSYTSSAQGDYFLISGLSKYSWGTITLFTDDSGMLDNLTKIRLHNAGQNQYIDFHGRLDLWNPPGVGYVTGAILHFNAEIDNTTTALSGSDIQLYTGTSATPITLQFLYDIGAHAEGTGSYELNFHFDRSIPGDYDSMNGSSDLNGLHNHYDDTGYWVGNILGTQPAGEITKIHWVDKYDSMYNSQRMNLMNYSFGRLVKVIEGTIGPIEVFKKIYGKSWGDARTTPWLGWGGGIQSYYENQLMNGKTSGSAGFDDQDSKNVISSKFVGSEIHCAWPLQDAEYIVDRHPLLYDGFYVGTGYKPGIMKTTWSEGYDIDVKDYDNAIIFMYCVISGTASSDGEIRIESKFKVSPSMTLPYVDETVSYDYTGGVDSSTGTGSFSAIATRSYDYAYYLGYWDLIYKKEMVYRHDDTTFNDSSWIIKKDLTGIGKMKLLTRAYTNPAAGVLPPDTSLLSIIYLVKKENKSVIVYNKDKGY